MVLQGKRQGKREIALVQHEEAQIAATQHAAEHAWLQGRRVAGGQPDVWLGGGRCVERCAANDVCGVRCTIPQNRVAEPIMQ